MCPSGVPSRDYQEPRLGYKTDCLSTSLWEPVWEPSFEIRGTLRPSSWVAMRLLWGLLQSCTLSRRPDNGQCCHSFSMLSSHCHEASLAHLSIPLRGPPSCWVISYAGLNQVWGWSGLELDTLRQCGWDLSALDNFNKTQSPLMKHGKKEQKKVVCVEPAFLCSHKL